MNTDDKIIVYIYCYDEFSHYNVSDSDLIFLNKGDVEGLSKWLEEIRPKFEFSCGGYTLNTSVKFYNTNGDILAEVKDRSIEKTIIDKCITTFKEQG